MEETTEQNADISDALNLNDNNNNSKINQHPHVKKYASSTAFTIGMCVKTGTF